MKATLARVPIRIALAHRRAHAPEIVMLAMRMSVVALVIAATAPRAAAQRLSDLSAGTPLRVRMVDARGRWQGGMLDSLTRDTLTLLGRDERLTLARNRIIAVQMRDADAARSTRIMDGIVLGGVSGLVADGLLVWLCRMNEHSPEPECGLGGIVLAIPATLLGATVGAIYNGTRSRTRWRRVEV